MDENIQENGGIEEKNGEQGQNLEDAWGDAMKEQSAAEAAGGGAGEKEARGAVAEPGKPSAAVKGAGTPAEPATFGSLSQEAVQGGSNLDLILDIPVTVAVELGRTRMLVKDLLALGQGAVVELEKLAGEAMEILVNGRLIARGEAVVVNEKFGIKLTDIVSPSERISKLS